MNNPKLYILPAHRAPKLLLPEEPNWPIKKTRIYDANGTEFVGLEEVSTTSDRLSPLDTIVTVRMRFGPGEVELLEGPLNPGRRAAMIREISDRLACGLCSLQPGSRQTIYDLVRSELDYALPRPSTEDAGHTVGG